MGLVFEAANGASLDEVRVPGFFTYNGFYAGLLDHMTTIAGALAKDNWVLGPSGEQSAVQQQFERLFPDILELYSHDFIAAWNVAIGNLALRPLLADRPKYLALSAASAPNSPIKQIFESIRNETVAHPRARGAAGAGRDQEPKRPTSPLRKAEAAVVDDGARGGRSRHEVATSRRRTAADDAGREYRGLFQADRAARRRRRRCAADRRAARQSQRTLPPVHARGEQSGAIQARAGAGRRRSGEPALQRQPAAAAARRHDEQGGARRRRRRLQPHHPAAHRPDGAGGDRARASRSSTTVTRSRAATATFRSPTSPASSRRTASSTASSPPISRRSPISAPRPGPGAAIPTSRGRSTWRRCGASSRRRKSATPSSRPAGRSRI